MTRSPVVENCRKPLWIRSRSLGPCLALAALVSLASAAPLVAQSVMITEFMAKNASTLADEDGAFGDWIELYNASDAPVNLGGWSLTDDADDLTRWTFPEMILPAGEFLVVFASGKDRRDPESELHTNFRISAGGESLFLVGPDQQIVEPSFEDFPEQIDDASYGVVMELETQPLIEEGAIAKYYVPENNDLELTWTELDFDDRSWAEGPTGIGFDVKDVPTYEDLIATDVAEIMFEQNASIYLRIRFTLAEEDLSKYLRFRAKFEDGLGVLINGEELALVNMRSLRYNRTASPERTAGQTRIFETIPLAEPTVLHAGENILALQLANRRRNNEDVLCIPELSVFDVRSVSSTDFKFFADPSPGRPNGDAREGVAPEPEFSHGGGMFTGAIALELSSSEPDARIRYTTDGSLPTVASDLYEQPIEVSRTMVIKARTFLDGFLPSPSVNSSFVALADGFKVDSNLPVFVVSVNNGTVSSSFVPMHMMMFDRNETGRSSSDDLPQFNDIGVIKTRGSSTGGRTKASYSLEIQDAFGDDKDVEIFDFPADSDFVLYGAFNFDRAHVRNAFIYELSNNIGRYATRTRFCELYLARNGGRLSNADYRGVYTFMEKIKRGEERVNIARLGPEHNSEPEISGGYIFKIDRLDPGDRGFNGAGAGRQMAWVYPKEQEVSTEQWNWVVGFFQEFNASLSLPDADDPELDYRKYIDELSWIDHHLLNEFTKNPDALRLSAYLFKDREGKLENGPVWDFDRTMGCDDDARAQDPVGWMGPRTSAWWGRLLTKPGFFRRYKIRWQELRKDEMATDTLLAMIDGMGEEIGEAGGRDGVKWRQVAGQRGFETEIQQLKSWVQRRVDWMDTQLVVAPEFSHPSGQVERGTVVTADVPVGEIFYTLDGSDPKRGNEPAAEAIAYTDAGITITENTRIRARARISDRLWSEVTQVVYITDQPTLAVTEIMYNPRDGDPEFLELYNFGDAPVDLNGMEISRKFAFTEEHVLAPGGYLVLTDDPALFKSRYGDGVRLDGEFSGRLSNTRMTVQLLGPKEELFIDFTYLDDWYPETDGDGYSIVLADPTSDPKTWSEAESWRQSTAVGGSPGADDEGTAAGMQLAGDITQDGGLDVSDAVSLLGHLFGGGVTAPCATDEGNLNLLDINGDGQLNVTDAVHELGFLFQGGAPPALGTDCVPIAGCPDACAGGG